MGMFKNEINEIIRAATKKYAGEYNCERSQVQIMMYLDEHGNDGYAIYLNSVFAKKVTVLEILCRKIDFTGVGLIVSNYVKKILNQYSKQYDVDPIKIRIMIVVDNDNRVLMYLLNGADAFRSLNGEEVFSDEKYSEVSNEVIKQIEQ